MLFECERPVMATVLSYCSRLQLTFYVIKSLLSKPFLSVLESEGRNVSYNLWNYGVVGLFAYRLR